MTVSEECLNEIKKFEGLRLKSYQDVVGIWTIGWGSTKGIKEGQEVTVEQATDLLKADILPCETAVTKLTNGKLNQNQFDSCVDLSFNCGIGLFSRSSILKLINEGKFTEAAEFFQEYDHAGGKVIPGLLVRRLWEKNHFLGKI
jgi:lysozyme